MSDQEEIILKLSHAIASRFSIHKWITAVFAIISLVVLIRVPMVSVLHSFISGIFTLSIIYFIYLFEHQRRMLVLLKGKNKSALSQLEIYMQRQQESWEKHYWWRVILVALIGLMMLFILIFFKDSSWSAWLAGLFPVLILAFILGGRSQFNDKILLHDVMRRKNV